MAKSSDLREYLKILDDLIDKFGTKRPLSGPSSKQQRAEDALRKALIKTSNVLAHNFLEVEPISYENPAVLRAVLAQYQDRPLSWEGSNYAHGRFHGAGQPTLYFAEDTETIAKEIPSAKFKNYQHLTFPSEILLTKIIDFQKKEHQAFMGGFFKFMLLEWAPFVDIYGQKPVTHIISDIARNHGIEAIRYESRVNGKYNLAVFPKNLISGSRIRLKDVQKGQSLPEMTRENLHLFTENFS